MPNDYEKLPTYPIVPLTKPFEDARGVIQNVLTTGVASVVVIDSKKGTTRADHYHLEDDHLCYLLLGNLDYYWVQYQNAYGPPMHEIRKVSIKPGQAWYTPNNCGHTMHFTEDSVFLTLSRRAREPEEYEKDLVRIPTLRPAEPVKAAPVDVTPAERPSAKTTPAKSKGK